MTKTPEYFAILALNQSLFLENKEQGASKNNKAKHEQPQTRTNGQPNTLL
jgi:hypothetical protein